LTDGCPLLQLFKQLVARLAMEKILIVDDEENTRIGLVKLLCRDGYQAEAVANGYEALAYIGTIRLT
jgi:CheY-like chemotaxis protein